MVKNTVGGNKSKGQARKHLSSNSNKALKVSEDECEVYAQVTKMLGKKSFKRSHGMKMSLYEVI